MNAPALSTRCFNERFDAAVRDRRLDLESLFALMALADELAERAQAPVPVRAEDRQEAAA